MERMVMYVRDTPLLESLIIASYSCGINKIRYKDIADMGVSYNVVKKFINNEILIPRYEFDENMNRYVRVYEINGDAKLDGRTLYRLEAFMPMISFALPKDVGRCLLRSHISFRAKTASVIKNKDVTKNIFGELNAENLSRLEKIRLISSQIVFTRFGAAVFFYGLADVLSANIDKVANDMVDYYSKYHDTVVDIIDDASLVISEIVIEGDIGIATNMFEGSSVYLINTPNNALYVLSTNRLVTSNSLLTLLVGLIGKKLDDPKEDIDKIRILIKYIEDKLFDIAVTHVPIVIQIDTIKAKISDLSDKLKAGKVAASYALKNVVNLIEKMKLTINDVRLDQDNKYIAGLIVFSNK